MTINSCLNCGKNFYESIGLNSVERDKAQSLIESMRRNNYSDVQLEIHQAIDTKELYFLDKKYASNIDKNFIATCLEKVKDNIRNNIPYDRIEQRFYRNNVSDYSFFQRVFSRQCTSILEGLDYNDNLIIDRLDEITNTVAKEVTNILEASFKKDLLKNNNLSNFVYSQRLENELLKSSTKVVGIFAICFGVVVFVSKKNFF